MVVVFGGVGNLWGTLIGGMSMGVVNKLLEPYAGAVLAKIFVLVALILFIQRRPRGLFPQTGRAAESLSVSADRRTWAGASGGPRRRGVPGAARGGGDRRADAQSGGSRLVAAAPLDLRADARSASTCATRCWRSPSISSGDTAAS